MQYSAFQEDATAGLKAVVSRTHLPRGKPVLDVEELGLSYKEGAIAAPLSN